MDRINTYKELDWDYYWSLPHPAHRDLAYLLNAPCLLADCDEFSVVPSSQFLAWFQEAKDWILADAIESPHKLLDFVKPLANTSWDSIRKIYFSIFWSTKRSSNCSCTINRSFKENSVSVPWTSSLKPPMERLSTGKWRSNTSCSGVPLRTGLTLWDPPTWTPWNANSPRWWADNCYFQTSQKRMPY